LHCFSRYAEMLAAAGINPTGVFEGGQQTCAYNLLATRRWMLIVPRQCDAVEGISVNGLGFAGHLLARDRTQADFIRQRGPLDILRRVGVPK
jgi:ATP adenylyltransferase